MPLKGAQIQSTSAHMDNPHQTSDGSPDHEPFLHDHLEDILLESSVGGECPPTNTTRRQYWKVQVRSKSYI